MTYSLKFTVCLLATISIGIPSKDRSSAQAAERPTLVDTCDPRPDILPRPFYENHTEYRQQYNRPRYMTGWIMHRISPTSQEAMVWCENNCAGSYDEKHMPPRYKRYFAPKPWEVLQTGARPDFPKATTGGHGDMMPAHERLEVVPRPLEERSASDN